MTEYLIRVPGTFRPDTAYLDIETRKVPAGGFRMANGETLNRRWQCFLAGIALNGYIRLIEMDDSETDHLKDIGNVLGSAPRGIYYEATRQFDEMILRGRFTTARRAHNSRPFFPAVPRAEYLPWREIKYRGTHPLADIRSATDISGYQVPQSWSNEKRREAVLIHNLRDVAELVAEYGYPDTECREWCYRILADDTFARSALESA